MRRLLFLPLVIVAAALLGCGVIGGDDDEGLYEGTVNVGITDTAPAGGTYNVRNIYPPNVREVLAIVQIDSGKAGQEVTGKWYQLATLQQKAANQTPEGIKVSEAGFTLESTAIDAASGKGGGTLRLIPNAPLPEDSYVLRVYVDGKLAKTVGFVVSQAATAQPAPVQPPVAPPPPPPAASSPVVPAATATPTRVPTP